jgi:hypothetical protein
MLALPAPDQLDFKLVRAMLGTQYPGVRVKPSSSTYARFVKSARCRRLAACTTPRFMWTTHSPRRPISPSKPSP